MRFNFNERKATAAAARLLELSGGHCDTLRLVKLLYLAERESLRLFRRPIFGDTYYSMPHGPVVSHTYDLIKGRPRHVGAGSIWDRSIAKAEGHVLHLLAPPDCSELSAQDLDVLEQVFREHDRDNTWELVEHPHQLPEWVDPHRSSVLIQLDHLLDLLDFSEVERARLTDEISIDAEFEQLFG